MAEYTAVTDRFFNSRTLWVFLAVLLTALPLRAQQYEGVTLVKPSLIADTTAVQAGKPFRVGLLLEMAPTWHTYWQYAGDAGFPTAIKWTLPAGFEAGAIQWPLPKRDKEPGDIEVYAYGEKVLLITTITPPAKIDGSTITIGADANWLVCAEICVPGSGKLSIELPVGAPAPANAEIFSEFEKLLPSANAPPYQLAWKRSGDLLELEISGLRDAKEVDLYPLPTETQQVGHPENSPITNGSAKITTNVKGDLRGVLMVETPEGRKGWYVSSNGSPAPGVEKVDVPTPKASNFGLWTALLYGFLGGLILNLMPCVLPVISLKIFGFIRQAGDDPRKILLHGLAFVAGIFVWFLGLAVVIVTIKSAGHEATWAFQFQNPWFNIVIGTLVFVFALNLFGVFEIVLPGKATNTLAEASGKSGYGGSFAQGLFATLLATPCTAPFLGSALGFAFSQSAGVIFAMFGAVALGMSAPYFLLSAKPGWMKALPKPGAWMERVKQFMGFPLIATLIWLLYILGNQKGMDTVVAFCAFLLCLALSCWIYGSFCGPLSKPRTQTISVILAAAIAVFGGWFFLGQQKSDEKFWTPFSQTELDKLLAEGKPVFLDFTADWCISCKFNERTAIDTPAVREAFAKSGVIPMQADWTNADPEITAALKKFGRVGVPFYVVYPAGKPDEPIILPELLTQQIVLDALAKAK
jgi:thiol:disulfide interchange protein DsbD